MKKQYRLLKAQDFKQVLDRRRCACKNASLSLYYMPNQLGHSRVGISVSKKLGNAVVRSRIRRQIRAQINLTDMLSLPYDIVIIAHNGYLTKSFQENANILISISKNLSVPSTEEQA